MKKFGTLQKLQLIYALVGMMFFYGIEQLFLDRYVGDKSARGYVTIVFALSLLLFDVPTGVIADRVGRKVCLIASVLIQMLSLLVLGSSNSLTGYICGNILFGLQMCLFNGAAQAFLYDWLADHQQTELYAKRQGMLYAWLLSGAGVANLCSGLIAHTWGLRMAYFASIIPGFLAFIVVTRLHEPAFEKKPDSIWYAHAGEALSVLRKHPVILRYTVLSIAATIMLYTIGEFGQIYLLQFHISTVTLGILWAITAAFAAGGRAGAHFFQHKPRLLALMCCVLLGAFGLGEKYIVGIGLFCLVYGVNEALSNVAETEVQYNTPSHMRATMLSLVNCTGNLTSIPVVLLFTTYNTHHGIIAANRTIAIGVAALLVATILWPVRPRQSQIA